jgi:pyridoxal phosphate enzyme (YggS family)
MSRSEELAANLDKVRDTMRGFNATLIVVTKTYPISDVQILKSFGVENFGENRNEEGLEKSAAVPATWHFQGGIQSRKLRDIAQWADVIHSLDTVRHIQKLDSLTPSPRKVFLQLSLDGDPERGGAVEGDLPPLADAVLASRNLELQGLMCVPPVNLDPHTAFSAIEEIHRKFQLAYPGASKLSAGMSGDYEIALQHGATHIRVGSSILGTRTSAQ